MRRSSVLALSLLALLAWLASPPRSVAAGTAIRLDTAGLVDRAELVFEGRVIAQRALLASPQRIDTEYTIAVDHTFLGEALPARLVRLPGGVLPDGRGMMLPGLPQLATGSAVILFLTDADATGMRMPVGLAQGELTVVTGPDGHKSIVRSAADLSLVDPHSGAVTPAAARSALDGQAVLDYAGTLAEIEAGVASKRARQAAERDRGGVPAPSGAPGAASGRASGGAPGARKEIR
jgi:hypothetical protein